MSDIQMLEMVQANLQKRFQYLQDSSLEAFSKMNMTVMNAGFHTDMFNIAYANGTVSDEAIEAVKSEFAKESLPFCWWVGFTSEEEDLEVRLHQSGFEASESELAMVFDCTLAIADKPTSLSFKSVSTSSDLGHCLEVFRTLLPDEIDAISTFYHQAKDRILSEDSELLFIVGYQDGRPVVTSSIMLDELCGGIYDVICSPEYQGKGFGTAMMLHAMQVIKGRGKQYCTLTATDSASYVYEKIGFKACGEMAVYTLAQ